MERATVALLVGVILMAGLASPANYHSMSDRDCVEAGYEEVISKLYHNLYDRLVTNPPGDEAQAEENFKRGVGVARHAREIALKSMEPK